MNGDSTGCISTFSLIEQLDIINEPPKQKTVKVVYLVGDNEFENEQDANDFIDRTNLEKVYDNTVCFYDFHSVAKELGLLK